MYKYVLYIGGETSLGDCELSCQCRCLMCRVRVARERRSRSFLYNGNVVPVVFLYTPIVNCNFPWKSFGYKADSLASLIRLLTLINVYMCMISWMIRPPCEITDQVAVGTQNCFSTLFYTPYTNIKTSAHYALKCTIARQKNSGEGARPPPQTSPTLGRGIPDTPSPDPIPSAFPFLFIYDSKTGDVCNQNGQLMLKLFIIEHISISAVM